MQLSFEVRPDYLRAEIAERVSVAEADAAIQAVSREMTAAGRPKVMIVVRDSQPVQWTQIHGISDLLTRATAVPGLRIALVGPDSWDVYTSHQEVMTLARHRGIAIASFRDERAAADWLAAAEVSA